MPHLANECRRYFPAVKFCDPASRRRALALLSGPLPELTLPDELRALIYQKRIANKSLIYKKDSFRPKSII